jgi:predicted nucleotidyltransferase
MADEQVILKVLVGSQAHGLAGAESDADYRGVFVTPTAQFFRLDFKYRGVRWMEGREDETYWEIAQFLTLALHGHPLALETLLAPVITMDQWGSELRSLFPAIWAPQPVYDAFLGYAMNQQKKLLEKKDARPAKYAVAYLRVLHNLCELLDKDSFIVEIGATPMGDILRRVKAGALTTGQIIDAGESLAQQASARLPHCSHRPDPELVNTYLHRLRKAFLS